MKTAFIRHRFRNREKLLELLWKNRLIAIRYRNIDSTDPRDYDGAGRQALERMWSYCTSGAIVGADYRLIRSSCMLVGRIRRGSKVKVLPWTDPVTKKLQYYKTVKLKCALEIPFSEYSLLCAVQPQQGTLTGWPKAKDTLESIVHHRPLKMQVTSLDPGQLEVLCYEYMRNCKFLRRLLLPIGRNLHDIDIVGINRNGTTVLAQVTHSTKSRTIQDKLKRLASYSGDSQELFFFGPQCGRIKCRGVRYVPIETVFMKMTTHKNTWSYRMIECMLH